MTEAEARKRFGLTKQDRISQEGVSWLIARTEDLLGVWSISKADRAELEKDLEAYKVLQREV
jgi:hypothetical protein